MQVSTIQIKIQIQKQAQKNITQTNITVITQYLTNYNKINKSKIKTKNLNLNLNIIQNNSQVIKSQIKYSLPSQNYENKNNYQSINYKILEHSNNQLISISTQIISKFIILPANICTLSRLIKQICCGYNIVSYHNFAHGFSLMHMFYQLVKLDRNFSNMYSKQQIGFTLIAALGHDLNHSGTNNGFEIKMKSQLAQIAQNQAVLEKMHIRILLSMFKNKKTDLLDKRANAQQMKQLMTRAILATDVAKHFKNLQKLKNLRQSNQFDSYNKQHKYFALEQAFHACDIGNPCLQYTEYINWAALLTYQFNKQTVLEQQNKVQVTEMLRFKGLKEFYTGQIGFVNALVLPLWKQLAGFWNGFNVYVSNIQNNLLQLKQNVQKEQKKIKS